MRHLDPRPTAMRATRVGVLTPHATAGAEVELPQLAMGRVSIRVARTEPDRAWDRQPASPRAALLAAARLEALDLAAARLRPASLDALALASTSTSYVLGDADEKAVVARLQHRWSVPVHSSGLAAVAALRSHRIKRVALVHPPWFDRQLHAEGVDYFRGRGFTVVGAGIADVPDDPERVTPEDVVAGISSHHRGDAEAIFIGGNGFRAAAAVQSLEDRLDCLVLESNQVLWWSVLSDIGGPSDLVGYGQLFRTPDARRHRTPPTHPRRKVEPCLECS